MCGDCPPLCRVCHFSRVIWKLIRLGIYFKGWHGRAESGARFTRLAAASRKCQRLPPEPVYQACFWRGLLCPVDLLPGAPHLRLAWSRSPGRLLRLLAEGPAGVKRLLLLVTIVSWARLGHLLPGHGGQVSSEQPLGWVTGPARGSSAALGEQGPRAVPTGRNDRSAVRFALL